eukprot:TRINITY_DN33237_c0_g1_i1.p1 TRINITY_DN33237_c0_g1~~TRINITY_DN33237_c0_g1_i1.p1  ORF type:complete len:280 (-),score=76.27 TRINITY_DN33237_c0_g1_i1:33-872(-)
MANVVEMVDKQTQDCEHACAADIMKGPLQANLQLYDRPDSTSSTDRAKYMLHDYKGPPRSIMTVLSCSTIDKLNLHEDEEDNESEYSDCQEDPCMRKHAISNEFGDAESTIMLARMYNTAEVDLVTKGILGGDGEDVAAVKNSSPERECNTAGADLVSKDILDAGGEYACVVSSGQPERQYEIAGVDFISKDVLDADDEDVSEVDSGFFERQYNTAGVDLVSKVILDADDEDMSAIHSGILEREYNTSGVDLVSKDSGGVSDGTPERQCKTAAGQCWLV